MKKLLTVFALFLAASFTQVSAQDTKRVGAQLIYGTNINSLGVGAVAEFPIADRMVISPGFSFYFPNKEGDGNYSVKTTAFELNGNLNYTFMEEDGILFYGIGGLNYTSIGVKSDIPMFGSSSYSNGRVGLNLGAGANFNIGQNFLPFGEIKYILGDFDRLVLAAGIKFDF